MMPNQTAVSFPKINSTKLFTYTIVIFTLALLFGFLILPVGMVVAKAFVSKEGLTLEFFRLLFENQIQTQAIMNSISLGFWTTLFATILSFPLALINSKFNYPGKALFSGLLLLPMVMPPFVGAIGVQRIFARFGSLNMFFLNNNIIDTPIDWLGQENIFWVVVLLEVLHLYPIMYLNLTAALANVDPSLEEMGSIIGLKKWRMHLDIHWPLIRPGFYAGAIIVFIWSLTDLGTPLLAGYHNTMPVHIFNLISDINENPVGYALVCVVIAITVGFFLLSRRLVSGKKFEMLARGHVTPSITNLTGKKAMVWVYPILLSVITIALIPHFSVLLTSISHKWFMTPLPQEFTMEYYQLIFKQELPLIGIKNSFFLASLSTIFDIVLGLLVAYIVTRKLIPAAGLLDSLVMVPLALPGIVLAFGYVITYTDTALDPLNNPVPLLVIAYGIRRLPFMVRSASAGLQQTNKNLEEASLVFGATRFQTLRKITMPLVTANLIAGALLCFSQAMLDVSDSLILAMKDRFYPLTKAIYALYLEQGQGEFVASALGMIAMLIIFACILLASSLLGKKMGELFRA